MKILKIIAYIIFSPIILIVHLINNIRISHLIKGKSINDLDKVSGVDFERIVAHLFRQMHFRVDTTPVSGDYGADIIARKWGIKIVIQCKLYYNHSVGNKAVNEVHASKGYYDADVAMVITNHHYSHPAEILASKLNVTLIDRTGMKRLLDGTPATNTQYMRGLVLQNLQYRRDK